MNKNDAIVQFNFILDGHFHYSHFGVILFALNFYSVELDLANQSDNAIPSRVNVNETSYSFDVIHTK